MEQVTRDRLAISLDIPAEAIHLREATAREQRRADAHAEGYWARIQDRVRPEPWALEHIGNAWLEKVDISLAADFAAGYRRRMREEKPTS